jgi:hypothetical protein
MADKNQTRAPRLPVVITIVVLVVVGGLYYAYHRQQKEYFTGRNLRLLSMLTAQVEGRVKLFSDFLKAQAAQAAAGNAIGKDPYAGSGIKFSDCSDNTPIGEVRRDVVETTDGWQLQLRTSTKSDATKPAVPKCATVEISDLVRPIFERRVGAAFDMLLIADENGTVIYSLRPPQNSSTLLGHEEEWIDDEEESPPTDTSAATATVGPTTGTAAPATVAPAATPIVAPATPTAPAATVATPTAPAAPTPAAPARAKASKRPVPSTAAVTTTASAKDVAMESTKAATGAIAERESGSALSITSLKALKIRKGLRADPVDIDPSTLIKGTDHFDVTLGGTDYVLFTQPYTFTRQPAGSDVKKRQWVVCGLVSASRFGYDVSAVSTSIILIAFALALLALCCWPFLRIALIDRGQPLAITDVVLIIVCTIVGAGVLTLALLDAFAYHGITQTADDQLEHFSIAVNNDFGRNVVRAVHVLALAEEWTLAEAQAAAKSGLPTQPIPQGLINDVRTGEYPYVESVAWIDDDGMQQARFASNTAGPRTNVGARRYFQLAKLERTGSVGGEPYVLQWVRSQATGGVRAVLAKKTRLAQDWDAPSAEKRSGPRPFAVIAMTTELIDISHAVQPPGVEMAIIDENGEVLYHSDTQRIGFENFFAEADHNRDLRSAVVARRAGRVNATYWGDDQSMFVLPLTGSRWTLVTFRAKRLTRVLNVEATLLTLMMLLLSATPYFLVYVIVLLLKPRYRAPRLWPDETRHRDYLRLAVLLAALLLLFCLNNYALAPWPSFPGIVLLPLLSIVTTYLVLHRTGTPRRFAIGIAVWIIVTIMLIVHMAFGVIDRERAFSDYADLARAFLVLATLAVATLTLVLLGGWKRSGRTFTLLRGLQSRYGYSTLYRLCGVLLMVIGVAMPVIGFFRISRNVELELMVKYGQLRAAADLEHRIDHIVTLNALPQKATLPATRYLFSDLLSNRLGLLFGSRWSLYPPVKNAAPWPRGNSDESACPERKEENSTDETSRTIPRWASSWLPALYEDSIAIQPLFDAGSADNLWRWCVNGPLITLVRKIHFDRDVASVVWNGHEPDKTQEEIVIVSHLPRSAFWKSSEEYEHDAIGDDAVDASSLHVLTMILIGAPLLSIFWYAAGFIAKRVLLIDIHEPDWLARKPLSPSLGEHIFLVRRDRDLNTLTKGLAFVDVSFASLDRDGDWAAILELLDSSEAGRNVRVTDFEYAVNDSAVNEKKLDWLERLLALGDRTVIVVSSVSPAYMMTTPAPPAADAIAYFQRWRALLQSFVTVTAEELDLRHEEWLRRNALHSVSQLTAAAPRTWLEKETAYNTFLRRLFKELEAETDLRRARKENDPDTDRQRLLDELGERAETYFAGLWSSCREDEKLILYYLAHNGLANSRGRRALRRLMARGLVRRNPNLELFSESFRLYVLEAARRENIVTLAREKSGASTWDALRIPFFVIIISFILLLFATQKDMLTTTTALATALTTGLPVLMKLIGVFTERRGEGKD